MFVDNSGSFHNLIHDMNFPNVSLNAYLSDIMDRSFANLKNYQSTSESLKDLSEKFYKTSSLDMFEKSDQANSDISEILGGAIARFARFDDPSKALFEALKSDNVKKGLKEFKIADVTKDMFNPDSKEFKDIDIYDFTHYLLMVNREPHENNPVLKRLIEAVKDMQKETKKGIKNKSLKRLASGDIIIGSSKVMVLGAINKLLEIKKLIDESPNNGKDIIVIGGNNSPPEVVEYIHKKHAKVGIERLDEDEITAFNFTYPKNAKAIIDYQGIQHALNKHGINSPSVKFSKQPPITYKDIANYRDIVKNADETIKRDNRNKSEFIFTTMFKEKGDYKNAPDYKKNIKEND
ncbi:hypothetical protein [Helicobacter pylori]|nr:hypothetical protein HPHPP1_0426 [Helicobacter pylori Hp P-1]